jgi:L-amino acid N-acyltransferase YncA
MLVRPATPADLPAVLAIVNREIREGVAHFGLREHTRSELEPWLANHPSLPFLAAAEPGGEVLGYARAGRWKDREAYDWATEVGVYVRPDAQGRGVGKALYQVLIPSLIALGYRSIIAGIALPNPASVRLHEAFGMRHLGDFHKVGFKHGQWIDVGYWELTVGEGPPAAIAPASSS